EGYHQSAVGHLSPFIHECRTYYLNSRFAAGYAACFLSAMKAVVANNKAQFTQVPDDTKVTAEVGIGMLETQGYGLAITLNIEMPGIDRMAAETLVSAAHLVCPYSNATRGNVDVNINII
ncbi:Ohr family peroxiredoxin, partial [Aeromonas allosaccharophila]|uniref:Ohr family peroxiredoxin n=1 Tax=Aeromonas allosaccharophila TaxID=656 RepID=UPI003986F6C6